MRDSEFRKEYPNVALFEEIAMRNSWACIGMEGVNKIVYEMNDRHLKQRFKITVEKEN
jgi:hypothetical protein